MKNNQFRGCSQPIENSDLDACEKALKRMLPRDFRQHYLKYNGGIPEDNLFPGNDEWEPLEVTDFYPVKYKKSAADHESSLLIEHYHLMRAKEVIPDGMLPFACDPGGNFFCLDLDDGTVYFYATDAFDPTLSVEENFLKAQRRLADSFEMFMGYLIHNSEYDSDEWPE